MSSPALIHVPKGYLVRIDKPASLRVTCVQGMLWITQYGDIRDHFLRPGQCYEPRDFGTVLLNGLQESWCRIAHSRRESEIHVRDRERLISWTPA